MEANNEQVEQLHKLVERLRKVFPELEQYKIKLSYEGLPERTYGQIRSSIKPGKIDYLASLKKAKLIFKYYVLENIEINFSKKILLLDGAIRKDVLFFIASHELTHFLNLPKQLDSTELGIDFDAHSEEFYKEHLERYNKFKKSRGEDPVVDIKNFEQIISITLHDTINEDKVIEQIITKDWNGKNGKKD